MQDSARGWGVSPDVGGSESRVCHSATPARCCDERRGECSKARAPGSGRRNGVAGGQWPVAGKDRAQGFGHRTPTRPWSVDRGQWSAKTPARRGPVRPRRRHAARPRAPHPKATPPSKAGPCSSRRVAALPRVGRMQGARGGRGGVWPEATSRVWPFWVWWAGRGFG